MIRIRLAIFATAMLAVCLSVELVDAGCGGGGGLLSRLRGGRRGGGASATSNYRYSESFSSSSYAPQPAIVPQQIVPQQIVPQQTIVPCPEQTFTVPLPRITVPLPQVQVRMLPPQVRLVSPPCPCPCGCATTGQCGCGQPPPPQGAPAPMAVPREVPPPKAIEPMQTSYRPVAVVRQPVARPVAAVNPYNSLRSLGVTFTGGCANGACGSCANRW
jgi:hypothetical protein